MADPCKICGGEYRMVERWYGGKRYVVAYACGDGHTPLDSLEALPMKDPWTRDFDAVSWKLRLDFSVMAPSPMAILRPDASALPDPLAKLANEMYDLPSGDLRKAAASEFLTLSEEWI